MKSTLSILLQAAFAVFLLSSCGSNPKSTLKEYSDAIYEQNLDKAYELLSSDDKKYSSREAFIAQYKKSIGFLSEPLAKKLGKHCKFEIIDTRESNDTAYITARQTVPSVDKMITQGQHKEESLLRAEVETYLEKHKELPTQTQEVKFTLLREDDGYKIFLNLGLPEQLKRLSAQIEESKVQLNYPKALSLLKQCYQLDPSEYRQEQIDEFVALIQRTAIPGKTITDDNIAITPVSIELRNVEYYATSFWEKTSSQKRVTRDKYLVMTYKVKNISEGQVFAPGDVFAADNHVADNYNNRMLNVDLGFRAFVDLYRNRVLQPGEEMTLHDVCHAPANEKAEKFSWQLQLRANNTKWPNCIKDFFVHFDRKDIRYMQQQLSDEQESSSAEQPNM